MNALLDRLDSIQLTPEIGLSADDVIVCKNLQAEYQQATRHVSATIEKLTDLENQLSEENLGANSLSYWTDSYGFHTSKFLGELECAPASLEVALERKIIEYFKKTYQLTITHDLYVSSKKNNNFNTPSIWQKVAAWVLATSQGDLSSAGFGVLKTTFRKHFGWRGEAKLKGATIQLENVLRLIDNCRIIGVRLASRHDGSVSLTSKVFDYFESRSLTGDDQFSKTFESLHRGDLKFPYNIELAGFDKVKSLKLFKNGRVDIHFTNSAAALEFYEMFSLESASEENRNR